MAADDRTAPDPGADQVASGEQVLTGGTSNDGLVVRVGGTVHRPQTRASPAVHALLRHLEDRGFDGAPRFLGEDEQGREVLEYVEGDVATAPYPAWSRSDEALAGAADLMRRYHQAVAGFDPDGLRWGSTWGSRVPDRYRGGLVSHNDPALDNLVFRDGRAVALIDFDLASPGSAVWDLALLVRLWVPLRDPADVADDLAARTHERLRLAVDAYGLPRADREDVVHAARASHGWCYDIVREGAGRGQPGYARFWTPAAQQRERRGHSWFATAEPDLAQAARSDG